MSDDTGDALSSPAAGLTRRILLGAATGAVALATSGLLLPAWLVEEAVADTHPVRGVQQRKEQQRQKHRHRREHRRKGHRRQDHGEDKQHGTPDAPRFGPDGIKLTVENETSSAFKIKFWYGTTGWFSQEGDLGSSGTYFAGTTDLHAGIEFLTERLPFVWVENPVAGMPNTTYQYGGSMGFFGYFGGTVDVNHGTLEVGAQTRHDLPFTSTTKYAITVRRERDDLGLKVFTMTVS
jgi:hypothetical protein